MSVNSLYVESDRSLRSPLNFFMLSEDWKSQPIKSGVLMKSPMMTKLVSYLKTL